MEKKIKKFRELIKEKKLIDSTLGILQWDLETTTPKKGRELLSEMVGYLSMKSYNIVTSEEFLNLVNFLKENEKKLDDIQRKEVDNIIKEYGEQATFETAVHGLHPELVRLLGRLNYRTSYGQNVLKHSIEVAHIAGIMAAEIGADVKLAKRAGLLHDIGKAVDHEMEGTHVEIGMDLLRRYRESKEVIHAMSTHHGDYEPQTIEAVLVTAADAISAARPGARRETLEAYIKRLEKLEEIANSYEGVEKSFAIQAGREIRIMVKPENVTDEGIHLLAREMTKRIEDELEYPGQIKVSIIRETRAIEYAK